MHFVLVYLYDAVLRLPLVLFCQIIKAPVYTTFSGIKENLSCVLAACLHENGVYVSRKQVLDLKDLEMLHLQVHRKM